MVVNDRHIRGICRQDALERGIGDCKTLHDHIANAGQLRCARNLELAGRVDEGAHAVDIDTHAISVGSVAAASIDDRVGRVVADQ